jgi:uncharacterized lipoprotein YmbA
MKRPDMNLRAAVVAAFVVAAGLAGCAVSDPSRYYLLGPSADPRAAAGPATSVSSLMVGVGPVTIPGYLDRLQIVTRSGEDRVEIWPYDRWAEPVDSGIAQALADAIASRTASERVAVFPWRGSVARLIEYQVVVAVVRFDGSPGRDVTLDTRWRIVGKDAKEIVFRRSMITEPVSGSGFAPLVAAMTRAISALGEEIAHEIQIDSAKRLVGTP